MLNGREKIINLIIIYHNHQQFYELLGPFFGSRKVAKEVGIHTYDDNDKTWFVAKSELKVIGIASVRGKLVSDCYVIPEYRGKGVFSELLFFILLNTKGNLKATCTSASKKAFSNAGFVEKSHTVNYTKMELNRA